MRGEPYWRLIREAEALLSRTEELHDYVTVRRLAGEAFHIACELKLGRELKNKAVELKIRAAHAAGRILARQELRGGDHKALKRIATSPRLADLGISHNDSSKWQKLALIPKVALDASLASAQDSGRRLSESDFMRLAAIMIRERNDWPSLPTNRGVDQDLVAELSRHQGLLVSQLEPLFSGGQTTSAATQRYIKYLLNEITIGLQKLLDTKL